MASPAWRRVRVVLALTDTAVLASLVAFVFPGRWLEAPAGTPAKADVIVLLGGDSRARLATGLELWRQGLALVECERMVGRRMVRPVLADGADQDGLLLRVPLSRRSWRDRAPGVIIRARGV